MRYYLGLAALGAVLAIAGCGEEVSPVERTTLSLARRGPDTVALDVRLPRGWHTYWHNPGESGLGPTLEWMVDSGSVDGALVLPAPERFVEQGIVTLGYGDRVRFLAPVPAAAREGKDVVARLRVLICREECIPVNLVDTLRFDDDGRGAGDDGPWVFPEADTLRGRAERGGEQIRCSLVWPHGVAKTGGLEFFPVPQEIMPSSLGWAHDGDTLRLQVAEIQPGMLAAARFSGLLVLREPSGTPRKAVPVMIYIEHTEQGGAR